MSTCTLWPRDVILDVYFWQPPTYTHRISLRKHSPNPNGSFPISGALTKTNNSRALTRTSPKQGVRYVLYTVYSVHLAIHYTVHYTKYYTIHIYYILCIILYARLYPTLLYSPLLYSTLPLLGVPPRGLAPAPHSRTASGSSLGAAAWHGRRRQRSPSFKGPKGET